MNGWEEWELKMKFRMRGGNGTMIGYKKRDRYSGSDGQFEQVLKIKIVEPQMTGELKSGI